VCARGGCADRHREVVKGGESSVVWESETAREVERETERESEKVWGWGERA
jgi:hypothetical protein